MNNKILLIIVIFLSVATWDLNTRLIWDAHSKTEQDSVNAIKIQQPFKLSAEQTSELAQRYLAYNGEDKQVDSSQIQGMSLSDQNLQNGRLDQLFAGDLRIRLSAVIRQPGGKSSKPQVFALLSTENIKEPQNKLEKIQLNQEFYGYRVQDIQLDHINLLSINDADRSITLPIYQKRLSASSEQTLNRKSL